MPEQLNQAVTVYGQFTSAGVPYLPLAPHVPTCTVRLLTATTEAVIVSAQATTPLPVTVQSVYTLVPGNNTAAGELMFVFTTTDPAVDDAVLRADVRVGQTWLQRIDAAISSISIQGIWDALTSALTTTGSIGKYIVDYLAAVRTQTDRIGSAGATVRSPVTESGDIELTQGADYNASDGMQLDFTIAGQPSFTGGSCILRITDKANTTTYVEITGTVTSATILRFEPTAAQTAAIPVDNLINVCRFEIAVSLVTSGRIVKPITVKDGICTVTKAARDI